MDLKKENLYLELVESLENQVKLYRTLLDIVRKEREILVAAKIDDLNENNKAKDACLVRLRTLENFRLKHAYELALAVGADVESPRLLEIATHLPGAHGEKLRSLHAALEVLIRRASEINKSNELLVQSALSSIGGAIDSIRETVQPKPTYARKGAMVASPEAGGHLVSREA